MAAVDLRYARALASVVAEQHLDAVQVRSQLSEFTSVLEASPELREVLEDPSIPEAQKLGVLNGLAERSGWPPAVRNFVAVIVKHDRLREYGAIVAAYVEVADAEGHVAEAEITTAREIGDSSKQLLEQQVSKLSGGSQVKATYKQDESLLGGAVVKVGSKVYDGSVKSQLEQLKAKLTSASSASGTEKKA
jgi:F-type H+-transporting ATPase subunit delta